MWKIYDMVALKGVDFKVPILEPLRAQAWILGGVSGNCFLVQPFGLNQPRAVKGVVYPSVTLFEGRPMDPSLIRTINYKTLGVTDPDEKTNYHKKAEVPFPRPGIGSKRIE